MGTDDVIHAVRIFRSAYTNYTEIDAKLKAEVMYRDYNINLLVFVAGVMGALGARAT